MNSKSPTKFDSYPKESRILLQQLHNLILEVAEEQELGPLDETPKWGQPSYGTKLGSTIRIDWSSKQADKCFVYFHCQTRLVEVFKEIYGETFEFEGKRAIVLSLDDQIPKRELGHCISLALQYHKLKHLPLLGA